LAAALLEESPYLMLDGYELAVEGAMGAARAGLLPPRTQMETDAREGAGETTGERFAEDVAG
jgi:hypothetical protein